MNDIKSIAVLGSGTMGAGIAAICARAGFTVILLDMNKEACDVAVSKMTAGRMPIIEDAALLDNITTGSFEELEMIQDCDWICEAIIEDIAIKREMFTRIEAVRKPNSIVSTNTSGIPLRDIYTDMPNNLQRDIAVTHFFNPVHIMKLVELVPGTKTRPEVITCLADFLGNTLGKGVVYAKDTVNFIGNRIGCMWILAGLHTAETAMFEQDLNIETVDALMSKPMGIPSTGLYGLVDLIGLDVMFNVGRNLEENLPADDSGRNFTALTKCTQSMYDHGQLGRKTGGGFYNLIRHDDGSKTMKVFDMVSEQWRDAKMVELADNEQSFADLFNSDSTNGRFVTNLMMTTLCYSANLIPDIADDIVNVDRAMRWGFAWQKGPFELIDELGADKLIDLVKRNEQPMPKMLQVLIDSGESRFYSADGEQFLATDGSWQNIA